MTGGAGFSKQAEQSLKNNHALGKIRKKLKFPDQSRSGKNANMKDLTDSISFRFQRKARINSFKWVFFCFLILLILLMIIFS